MGWTTYQLFIAGLMVITGSINTLSTKWADNQESLGTERVHVFNHPFLQAVGMFVGESLCLVLYFIVRRVKGDNFKSDEQKFNPLLLIPASLCDMCGTSVLYIGLNMTYASSFQMLRGSVIIFTAFLSVAFLRRIIKPSMWLGMSLILVGLVLVGLADVIFKSAVKRDDNGIAAGDLLIVAAQVIIATQMVYEEGVISKYNIHPLKVVGLEGLFGMTILGVLLIPFYYINGGTFFRTNPNFRVEDPLDAFEQMRNNVIIIIAVTGNILSIAFFNFAGVSVTKEISATTRMVLDSLRTIVIWAVSLIVAWQSFQFLQLIGFIILLVGMCFYNNIVIVPLINKYILKKKDTPDLTLPASLDYQYDVSAPLLDEHEIDYPSIQTKS